jgi:hypothetical protein
MTLLISCKTIFPSKDQGFVITKGPSDRAQESLLDGIISWSRIRQRLWQITQQWSIHGQPFRFYSCYTWNIKYFITLQWKHIYYTYPHILKWNKRYFQIFSNKKQINPVYNWFLHHLFMDATIVKNGSFNCWPLLRPCETCYAEHSIERSMHPYHHVSRSHT